MTTNTRNTEIRQATRTIAGTKSSKVAIAALLFALTTQLQAANNGHPAGNRSGSTASHPSAGSTYRAPSANRSTSNTAFRGSSARNGMASSQRTSAAPANRATSRNTASAASFRNTSARSSAPKSTTPSPVNKPSTGTSSNTNTNKNTNTNINTNINKNTNTYSGSNGAGANGLGTRGTGTKSTGSNVGSGSKGNGTNTGTGGNGVATNTNTNVNKNTNINTNTNINNNTNININKSRGGRNGGDVVGRDKGHIPDNRFRSEFGRGHEFHVDHPIMIGGHLGFRYAGVSFGFVEPMPVDWMDTDPVYVDYTAGSYFLCNRVHPGVRVAVNIGDCPICAQAPVVASNNTDCTDCGASDQSDQSDSDGVTTLARGQTIDQVVAILGNPKDIVDLGVRKIYVFGDMRITFIGGRLSDAR
jgi:hypothetical protein